MTTKTELPPIEQSPRRITDNVHDVTLMQFMTHLPLEHCPMVLKLFRDPSYAEKAERAMMERATLEVHAEFERRLKAR